MTQKIVFLPMVVLLTIGASSNAVSQWVQSNGPYGTLISCFAVSGTKLFAGSSIGVFLTTDSGTSWTAIDSGLTDKNVLTLAVSGTNLFCGTGGNGVFLSTDNGTSWNAVGNGLPQELPNKTLLALAVSGTDLLAQTWAGSVFLTTNNGMHWTPLKTPQPDTNILTMAAIGTHLFVATGGPTSIGRTYVTTNNGENWTAVNSGLTDSTVYHFAVSGTNLFAATSSGRVFRWTDSTTRWTPADSGLHGAFLYNLWASGTDVLAQTGDSVFRSTDNGAIWHPFNDGTGGNRHMTMTALIGKNLFAASSYGGIIVSSNEGSSWTPVNTGIGNILVSCLASCGDNLFAGSMNYSIGPFLSTDEGTSWTQVNDKFWTAHVRSIAVIGTNVLAGTGGYEDGGVYRSTDKGTTWTNVYPGFGDYDIYRAFAVSGANLFVATTGTVLRSTDSGRTWAAADSTNSQSFQGGSVTAFAVLGDNLFAGTVGSGVFLSTNNGGSWTKINDGLWNLEIRALAVCGTTIIAATNILGDDYGGVFLSTNNGGSWTRVGQEMTSYCTVDAFALNGTNVFASTSFGIPYLSTDHGLSWTPVKTGLPKTHITSLLTSSTYLFAGTDTGVWRRPLSEMIPTNAVAPTALMRSTLLAYPNPLTQSTTIDFTTTESGTARITIVDMLGKEVSRIFDGELPAAADGQRHFAWSARGIPPGIYWCEVRMNGHVERVAIVVER